MSLFAMIPLLLVLPSHAGKGQETETQVAITLSPIHLVIGFVELTGEYRVADKFGVAAIGGYGKPLGVSMLELGAQGRWYALGDFDSGLQLGAEALYVGGSTEQAGISSSGSGVMASPFVGGKHTFGFGLVLDGQIGYGRMLMKAKAEGEGESLSSDSSDWGALLNLNFGWAF